MQNPKLLLCAGVATLGLALASQAFADDQSAPPASPPAASAAPAAPASPPAPTPPPYPSMGPTLSNNANSASFDAGPLGKLYVNGDFSGLVYGQNNPGYDPIAGSLNKETGIDFSNALVTIQKDDGPVQFVIQAGGYSFPALGGTYIKATEQTSNTFGLVPVGYIKIVPNSTFSFEVGQLPTLIGAELPFTYENANIERGLLWNQEPLISRGIQANFTQGPWAVPFAYTDGYYSDQYRRFPVRRPTPSRTPTRWSSPGRATASTNLPCSVGIHRLQCAVRYADRPAGRPDLQRHLHPHPGSVDDHAVHPIQHRARTS